MDGHAATGDGKTTGWRGSRELWLDAAREALLDGGVHAVKIQSLATALGLSRTSFYWFFRDRAAILAALLDEWEAVNTGSLVAACEAYAESVPEAVLNVIGVFLDGGGFDARFDSGIRGWAHGSDAVQGRVAAADAARLAALAALFVRFGTDPAEADVRARTIYLVQIGYIALQTREDMATRMARIPAYVKTYAGRAPDARELARFHARHGFVPPDREGGVSWGRGGGAEPRPPGARWGNDATPGRRRFAMADPKDALSTLHTRLIDSRDGYEQARDQIGDEDAGRFVERCLTERRGFHAALHEALAAEGINVEEGGSTAASVHRGVFKLRDAVSSGPSGIYAECARGDGVLKSAYDDAIAATEGQPRWQFLAEQRAKIDAAISEANGLA